MENGTSPGSEMEQSLSRRRALQGIAAAGGGLALFGIGAWYFNRSSNEALDEVDARLLAWPAEDRWPEVFSQAPASVQDIYRYAVANKNLIQWMPCFCGCVEQGHTSNFDCYVKAERGDGSIVLDTMSFG